MDRAAALAPYLEAGMDLIPIHAWDARDGRGRERGKSPLHPGWRRREYGANEPVEWIEHGLNAGLRIGPSQVVLDYDPRNDPSAVPPEVADGRRNDSLERLARELGLGGADAWAAWPCVRTGGGGLHVYMQLSREMRVLGELPDFPGVEFKGHGRQVLIAGSRHPSGNWYAWDDFSEPLAAGGLPAAPAALEALIERRAAPEGEARVGRLTGAQVGRLLRWLEADDYRDHDSWLQLGMACWHACGGAEDGREAFVAWSATDPQYAGHEALVRERWETWAPDGPGAVTYRTLFQAVLDAGGRLDGVDDFPDDLPPLGEGEECRNDPDGGAGEEADEGGQLAALNREYCKVPIGDDVRILSVHDGAWRRQRVSAFREMLRGEWIERPGPRGPRQLALADAWLDWPRHRQYEGAMFLPGREVPDGYLNLWTGWAVEPRPGGRWDLLENLIREVLCDDDENAGEYVLDWCAWLYQRPWVLPEVAIVLRGGKGAGKGTFGRALTALAGLHALHFSDAKLLAGSFNGHLEDRVVLFGDEAFWAGNRAHEAQLKQLITEPQATWHHKGLTPYWGRNFAHLVLASNSDWVVPASMDERRFCVLDVPEDRIRGAAFFRALNEQLYLPDGSPGPGLAAFAHALATRELGVHPRENVPQTKGLIAQKLLSLEPLWDAWYEALLVGRLCGAEGEDWTAGPIYVERDALTRGLVKHAERVGGRFDTARAGSTKVGMMLQRLCPGTRTEKSGTSRRYVVPPLADARAQFERALGRSLPWGG